MAFSLVVEMLNLRAGHRDPEPQAPVTLRRPYVAKDDALGSLALDPATWRLVFAGRWRAKPPSSEPWFPGFDDATPAIPPRV